jgi:hypothetical protein
MNFSPEMLKQASNMMSGMSDEQLKNMMSSAGFGGMDPSMMRNAANMMNSGGMPGGMPGGGYMP